MQPVVCAVRDASLKWKQYLQSQQTLLIKSAAA